ncbi:MAG: putative glycoside hydrolase [Methylococcales bacterium]
MPKLTKRKTVKIFSLPWLVLLGFGLSSPSMATVEEIRISANADDAEEINTGKILLNSRDIDLTYSRSLNTSGGHQTIGLRFRNIKIPNGATVTNAYIQFKANETGSQTTKVTIRGQSVDNAPIFNFTSKNISSRSKTGAAVSWSPNPWVSLGQAGTSQRTPNIASVLQEIVRRSGWSWGNSVAIIMSGTGKRAAESYNGDQAGAALLHIEYNTSGSAPAPAPAPAPEPTPAPRSPSVDNGTLLYPRVGGMNIGVSNYDNQQYQKDLAKLDLVILGFQSNWHKGGLSKSDVLRRLKSLNPKILVGQYTMAQETPKSGRASEDVFNKLSGERGANGQGDWFARNVNGNRITSFPNTWSINVSPFVKPDNNGDRFPTWFAKRNTDVFFTDTDFDILYIDGIEPKPRPAEGKADWDGDGRTDDDDNSVVKQWYRDAMAKYAKKLKSLNPGKLIMGNVISWVNPSPWQGPFNQYNKLLDGGYVEHGIGRSWSIETWGAWTVLLDNYHKTTDHMKGPKIMLFETIGGKWDFRLMRYGLATALLGDGMYNYTDIANEYNSVLWFDEFDLAGRKSTGWLGKAIEPRQYSPWQNGVYRRKFQNGMVLVFPKQPNDRNNNVTEKRTVTIESGYHRIDGSQDRSVNNGEAVSTITLRERDGIVLVRDGF